VVEAVAVVVAVGVALPPTHTISACVRSIIWGRNRAGERSRRSRRRRRVVVAAVAVAAMPTTTTTTTTVTR
jgi:hypothetical protein